MAELAGKLWRRRNPHPAIEGKNTLVVRNDRVKVDLAHFGDVGRQLRELDEGERDRGHVRRRGRPIARQELGDRRAFNQPTREVHIERHQIKGPINNHFHRAPAAAKHHDRAEHGIIRQAANELDRSLAVNHRHHDDALDRLIGMSGADALDHAVGGGFHLARCLEIENNAARIRLKGEIRRGNFNHHPLVGREQDP